MVRDAVRHRAYFDKGTPFYWEPLNPPWAFYACLSSIHDASVLLATLAFEALLPPGGGDLNPMPRAPAKVHGLARCHLKLLYDIT